MGVPLDEGTTIYSLSYADDLVIVAQDEEDASYMTSKLMEECPKWGLEININKCEYLVIGHPHTPSLLLDGGEKI
uniref:Reverse transcriptase domain-containing protein n=1 Tax=Rhodnius prolixus TaxID=13249 RepID=T1HCD5_RHOPR